MTEKRYQYIGMGGKILWTPWMPHTGDKPPYQLGRKLRNEYREV